MGAGTTAGFSTASLMDAPQGNRAPINVGWVRRQVWLPGSTITGYSGATAPGLHRLPRFVSGELYARTFAH
ncbi:hypothetical protein BC2230_40006 [Burkholderia cepacia]